MWSSTTDPCRIAPRAAHRGALATLAGALLAALALPVAAGHVDPSAPTPSPEWSDREQRILASLLLPAGTRPPPSPSNRYADDPDAARLGRAMFFDRRLSAGGGLSCASCHQPDRYFTDGLTRATGVARTSRHTPTIVGAAFQSWFYWDGRRDSLWAQALVPFEAPDEMGSSRTAVVRLVGRDPSYRRRYEAIFGTYPALLRSDTIPTQAGPLGTAATRAAWSRLSTPIRAAIDGVYANLGKAIAAYERSLPLPRTRFDRYVERVLQRDGAGARRLLSADERAGLALFIDSERTHCLRCHNGPWFTNGGFHNVGSGVFEGPELDFGRVFGLRAALMDPFNCLGPHSDAAPEDCHALRFLNTSAHIPLEGAFKVPGLRNVSSTAPYFHDGRFPDLAAVIAFYRAAGGTAADHELPPLTISDREAAQLVAFLETLAVEGVAQEAVASRALPAER
jgi:cytochrome c peroxidase